MMIRLIYQKRATMQPDPTKQPDLPTELDKMRDSMNSILDQLRKFGTTEEIKVVEFPEVEIVGRGLRLTAVANITDEAGYFKWAGEL